MADDPGPPLRRPIGEPAADAAGRTPRGGCSVAAPSSSAEHVAPAAADAGRSEPDAASAPLIGAAEPEAIEPDVPVTGGTPAPDPVSTMPVEAPVAAAASPELPRPEDGPAFLAKLARAMHTTVTRERARIDEDVERRRSAHLQVVRDRAAADEERIRALAADDMMSIEAWAEGEMRRLKLEREQKERELNDDLEVSLKDLGAKTDREIASAEAAIAAYRAEAETFFADLDRETDPVQIARQASRHPAFPSLDGIPDVAADAVTADRSGAIGVMGVPLVGGRGLMGAMSFGSRPLAGGTPAVAGGAPHGPAREAATVAGRAGNQAGGSEDSPLDSLLSPRTEG